VGEAALGNGEIVKGIRTEKQFFDAVTAGLKNRQPASSHRNRYAGDVIQLGWKTSKITLIWLKIQAILPGAVGRDSILLRRNRIALRFSFSDSANAIGSIYKCKNCGYTNENYFPTVETADPSLCQYLTLEEIIAKNSKVYNNIIDIS